MRSILSPRLFLLALGCLLLAAVTPPVPASPQTRAPYDEALFQALEYRFLGPYRGGRSSAVTGVPDDPFTFYAGSPGGVWRTTNAGETWHNVSDDDFEVGSVGAVAVSRSDPNVVYVGTGQATIRANVSIGKGVYKSTDGGDTWAHVGLREVGQIARVRIHPDDPDVVYVAATGNPFAHGEHRGVYRSRDGGDTWEKVLYLGEETGIAKLLMDPANPRVLYAAGWTVQRKPWTIVSGGGEDGLYKSTDGGDTWERLEGGLPTGLVGKIGVAVSPANPDRVWALVEAEPEIAGLYRSDDAGATWERLEPDQGRRLYQRSWYYMHIVAHPADEDTVYVLNVDAFVSIDGGSTFEEIDSIQHGDVHDLWINPDHPRIMVMADDGGAEVSLDGGRTWSTQRNQPTAEMYYVFVDEQFPYHVYGSQQDNTTIRLPSRFTEGRITPYGYWRDVGGCENAHIAFDPHDPTVVYAGCYGGEITRVDLETGDSQQILAYPQMEFGMAPRELRYRFHWNAPVRVSPHDPDVVYHAAQKVLRTTDGGHGWTEISPDLTTDDPETQDYSGEPITYENTGAEVFNSILTFEESPHEAGVLWAGSADGRIHVSRDAGSSWTDVTPPELPQPATINVLELSPREPGRAYVAVRRFMFDDWRPHAYRTDDHGASWTRLTDGDNGIPGDHPVRVVREDPDRPGLLYAGTEFGAFVSFDDGGAWQPLQLNLPPVPITDLKVHRRDLVVATQGRGFWILDDVTPLHHVAEAAGSAPAYLYPPRDTHRLDLDPSGDESSRAGENPPEGVMIFYTLDDEPDEEVRLEILGPDGGVIREFSSAGPPEIDPERIYMAERGQDVVPAEPGINRFVWNFRHPPVDIPDDVVVWGLTHGPRARPGEYRVRLSVGDWSRERGFRILKDPRLDTTQADFDAQEELLLEMRESLELLYDAVRAVRSLRQQAHGAVARLGEAGEEVGDLESGAAALDARLSAIEEQLMQPRMEAMQDVENFPQKLDNQLAYVYWFVDMAEHRPTEGQVERYRDLRAELDDILAELRQVIDEDVAGLRARLREAGAGPLIVPAPFADG